MKTKFLATFNQAVEGVETVEVVVEAPDFDTAVELIEVGDYVRYRVIDNQFVRTKQIGTIQMEEVFD